MNKNELVGAIARSSEQTKADAENALNALIGCLQTAVANGEKVVLARFGTLAPSFRNARTGMNPQTRANLCRSGEYNREGHGRLRVQGAPQLLDPASANRAIATPAAHGAVTAVSVG